MLSRTWVVVLWVWLCTRIVVMFLFMACVVSILMLAAMSILGILGCLEWWVFGTRRCWDLTTTMDGWGKKNLPHLP